MSSTRVEHDGTSPRPPLGGSLLYLLLNFPLGIAWFTTLVAAIAVGAATAIVWVGVAVTALAVLVWRGGAQLERARSRALLDTYIAVPYHRQPGASRTARWKTRMRERPTWRDLSYLLLLFPLGTVQFVALVSCWSTSLALVGLPIYYRFLPGGAYHFPSSDVRWISVDSTLEALVWAALGVFCIALSVKLTRAMAAAHARFARRLLGPSPTRLADDERTDVPFGPAPPTPPAAGSPRPEPTVPGGPAAEQNRGT